MAESAHRYWRIVMVGGYAAAEIEMRATASGADQCSGGTASTNSLRGENPPANAFDDNTGTVFRTANQASFNWIQYDFGSGNDKFVREIAWTTRNDGFYGEAPTTITVQWSDDNVNFYVAWNHRFPSAWTQGATQIATKPNEPTTTSGHRYWRVYCTAGNAGYRVSHSRFSVFEYNSSQDIALLCSAFGDSSYPGLVTAYMVDGNDGTTWGTADGDTAPWAFGIDFGPDRTPAINKLVLRARNSFPNESVNTGDFQYSDDNVNWYTEGSFSGLTFSEGEVKTILDNLAPPPDITLFPGVGTVTVTGLAPDDLYSYNALVGAGSVSLTGYAPDFFASFDAELGVGAVSLTGYAPDFSATLEAAPGVGAVTFTGYAPDLSASFNTELGVGAVTVSGLAPDDLYSYNALVGVGSVSFTGEQPAIELSVGALPGIDTIVFTGRPIYFAIPATVTVGVGSLTFSGFAPSLAVNVDATPGAGLVAFQGQETNTSIGYATIRPGYGSLRFIGYKVNQQADAILLPGAGQITFNQTGDLGGNTLSVGKGTVRFTGQFPNQAGPGILLQTLVQSAIADSLVELYELDATAIGGSVYRWTPGPVFDAPSGRLTEDGTTTVITLDREVDVNAVVMDYTFFADLPDGSGIQQAPVASFAVVGGKTEVTLSSPLSQAPITGSAWTLRGVGNVKFGGVTYEPLPIESEGFEMNGKGQLPTPLLRTANNPTISAMLTTGGDLLGAKVTRIRTFKRFLDGMPQANSLAILAQPDIFRVDRKSKQNRGQIELELAAWTDQQGIQIPRRQVVRDTCTHSYRRWKTTAFVYGTCPYTGDDFFTHDNQATGDPAADSCSRKLQGCILRFGENGNLPTRAFPGVSQT